MFVRGKDSLLPVVKIGSPMAFTWRSASPLATFHFLPLFLLWACSEISLSYILVSEYYVGIIHKATVLVFSLGFLYKIVKAVRTLCYVTEAPTEMVR